MLPADYVRLAALPLTPNGKLDRKALPAPDAAASAQCVYESPQGAVEQTLAGIWSELFGVEQVGRNDNFFALGGHSLLAIRLIERMRCECLYADVTAFFTAATLRDLAAQIATRIDERNESPGDARDAAPGRAEPPAWPAWSDVEEFRL
jgi:hypothetical protein